MFNEQVCSVMKTSLTENLNRLLAQVPNVLELDKNLALKWQVKPLITQDYLQFSLFTKAITEKVSPYAPAKCEMKVDGSPQALLTVSDAVFNDLCFQAYKSGIWQFTVSPTSASRLYDTIRLDCDQSGVCLGNVDKKLPERFGKDALVELHMEAAAAPTVEFKDGKAAMTASLRATLHITKNEQGAKPTLVASGVVTVSGPLQVKFQDGMAYAKVTIENTKLKVEQSELQHWEQDLKKIVTDLVQTYVNGTLLLKGIPMRLPLALENASAKFSEHCMQASGSLNYKPVVSSKESPKK